MAGFYGTGSGMTASSSACPGCQAGSYSSASGMSICLLCAAGTYSLSTGLSSSSYCSQCHAGSYGTGYGMTAPNTACIWCQAGSYSSGSGMIDSTSACLGCQAGSYNSGSGASTCTFCQTGAYSTGLGNSVCQQCVACGAFQVSLTTCPIGSTADTTKCMCSAGYYGTVPTGCTQCPPNTNSTQGSTTALGCRCFAGYACTYTKVIRVSLYMNFNHTPAPTTADILLNSALMASVAQAAGVPVSNIQIVGITPVQPGGRRLLNHEITYEVVCLVSGVGLARSRGLRAMGLKVWHNEEYYLTVQRGKAVKAL